MALSQIGKHVNLKKTPCGYEYAERKGVHSVAFILYDTCSETLGLCLEFKPPIDSWLLGAFGGSIDPKKSLKDIVIQEVKEEAGFDVLESDVHFIGKYFVSTQMNQFCYLYAVDVDRFNCSEPTTNDPTEKLSSVEWVKVTDQIKLEDWKATLLAWNVKKRFF